MAPEICKEEILRIIKFSDPDPLAVSDITFLSANGKTGKLVVALLDELGIRTIHTFDDDSKNSRRMKMYFFMGDARVKATTLHSFKGWETRSVVIFIEQIISNRTFALIYTGLTRLKYCLEGSFITFVSYEGNLIPYGKTWPEYVEKRGV
jgi:hypothetical protein